MSRKRRYVLAGGAVAAALLTSGAVHMISGNDSNEPAADTARPPAASAGSEPAVPGGTARAELPRGARDYVDAVAAEDLDALVGSFAPDATIIDVSREIRGHDAIRHWADTEVIGGRLTVLGNTPRPGGTTLLVRFAPGGTGGFRATYDFDISDGLITRADLQYA